MVTKLNGCRLDSRSLPDGSMSVAISGELDAVNTSEVSRMLCDVASRCDVTLDLGEVRFIDSGGLRALLSVARSARDAGRSLRLVQVTPRTSKLIELAGLTEVLNIESPGQSGCVDQPVATTGRECP